MLAAERHSQIVDLLHAHGVVRVTELVERFGISDMTVRRDLDTLAAQGTLTKVHGGAVAKQVRRAEEPAFSAKAQQTAKYKAAIATEAAQRIEPGMAVALSAGTTTWTLAQRITAMADLTVLTNSTRISDVFHASPRQDRTVILTGGIRTRSDALVGPTAVTACKDMHVDLAFLGAHGMTIGAGFTTPNYLEADTNRGLLSAAQRRIILADHSKWDIMGMVTFAEFQEVDTLITDDALSEQSSRHLCERLAELVTVSPSTAGLATSPGCTPAPSITTPEEPCT